MTDLKDRAPNGIFQKFTNELNKLPKDERSEQIDLAAKGTDYIVQKVAEFENTKDVPVQKFVKEINSVSLTNEIKTAVKSIKKINEIGELEYQRQKNENK